MINQTKDTPVGLSTEEARIEVDPQMLEVELHVPETQLPPVREGAEPAAQPSLGGVLVVISVVLDQFQGVNLEAEGLGTHNAEVPQVRQNGGVGKLAESLREVNVLGGRHPTLRGPAVLVILQDL